MGFNKKTNYESVYEWAARDEGTCFYCKDNKEINKPFFQDKENPKGICDDCSKVFKIGHIGADRHAIGALAPEFKTYKDAEQWLVSHGANLKYKHTVNGIHFYDCINDLATYKKMQQMCRTQGYCEATTELLGSYNSVEISEDGNIHIIY